MAIPVFLLFVAIELLLNKIKKNGYYRVNDTINSLSTGILSRITAIFLLLIPFSVYQYVYDNYALWQSQTDNLTIWLIALVGYDFCYYWFQRYAHEINILWAAHVVHHQSEEYNLSTALRQTSTSAWFGWFFYLPMALSLSQFYIISDSIMFYRDRLVF